MHFCPDSYQSHISYWSQLLVQVVGYFESIFGISIYSYIQYTVVYTIYNIQYTIYSYIQYTGVSSSRDFCETLKKTHLFRVGSSSDGACTSESDSL